MSQDFTDLFSPAASAYAANRPRHPQIVYDHILSYMGRGVAGDGADASGRVGVCLDCATGQGQAAIQLARYFSAVVATDASEEQLKHAFPAENITYRRTKAEESGMPDAAVDHVNVAAGIHWFDIPAFMKECNRVLVAGGTASFFTYSRTRFVDAEEATKVINHFWDVTLQPYKNPKMHLVDSLYEELDVAPLGNRKRFTFEVPATYTIGSFLKLQSTVSPVITMRGKGLDPIPDLTRDLLNAFGTTDLNTNVPALVQYCLVCAQKSP
eukprot:ANDGO_08462.mRNA.1 Putative methyltransferase DDB_G0268948